MREKIVRSIVREMAIFFAAQVVLYTAASFLCGNVRPAWAFYPISAALHAIVIAFLIKLKDAFIVESDGRRLESVNLANLVTLVRISTVPTLLFLLLAAARVGDPGMAMSGRALAVILVLSALVFATDLADGFIARRFRQGTKMGRMLDSFSDYLLLGCLSIALVNFDLIDLWFFCLVLFRLLYQAIGMTAFYLAHRPVEPRPTLPGKAAVASTMILYGLALIKALARGRFDGTFLIFEVIAAVIVALSLADKTMVFIRHYRTANAAHDGGR